MKKIKLLSLLMVGVLSVNFSLANQTTLEEAKQKIQNYQQTLQEKYENGEITQEKMKEKLKNRLFIMKEKYGDKLPDEFYDKMNQAAEKISEIGNTLKDKFTQAGEKIWNEAEKNNLDEKLIELKNYLADQIQKFPERFEDIKDQIDSSYRENISPEHRQTIETTIQKYKTAAKKLQQQAEDLSDPEKIEEINQKIKKMKKQLPQKIEKYLEKQAQKYGNKLSASIKGQIEKAVDNLRSRISRKSKDQQIKVLQNIKTKIQKKKKSTANERIKNILGFLNQKINKEINKLK